MLILWIGAAALAAQTTTSTPKQSGAPKAPETITITGCVERADEMAAAGTVGTTVDSLHFVLINTPTEATGTSGSKPSGPSMDKGYRLDAALDKLNPHVGHKVEITGFVEAPAASADGTATSVNGPMVKVQTIKMLSETCAR